MLETSWSKYTCIYIIEHKGNMLPWTSKSNFVAIEAWLFWQYEAKPYTKTTPNTEKVNQGQNTAANCKKPSSRARGGIQSKQ
jgi:hypothetical protein